MGQVHPGIPTLLALFLKEEFNIKNFVETGTYLGKTAFWASKLFNNVYTIEASEKLWEAAKKRFGALKNVNFLLGDSRQRLKEISENSYSKTLYWLDAHWSGGNTYGEEDECPLLEELTIIDHMDPDPFIIIDDARLFLAPPPLPHSATQWPTISSIVNKVQSFRGAYPYLVVLEDVIVIVPLYAKDSLVRFIQTKDQDKPSLSNSSKSNRSRILKILRRI